MKRERKRARREREGDKRGGSEILNNSVIIISNLPDIMQESTNVLYFQRVKN